MEIDEKNIRKLTLMILLIILGIFSFFIIKLIVLSIFGGLLLAYIFTPVYKKINKKIKSRNISAAIVSSAVVLITVLILWIFIPIIVQQVFNSFQNFQYFEIQNTIDKFLPTASEQFIIQASTAITSFISQITSGLLNLLITFFLDLPKIFINAFVIAFIFFYAMRDSDKLRLFIEGISPISKSKEKLLTQQFKEITDSVVYGQIIIGIIQGLVAGFGFFIFGIPNPFALTILAVFFSIIPIVGPIIVWAPIAVYLFTTSSMLTFILFIIYNLVLVSFIDNILRIYIISKTTTISTVTFLIGMIGGLFLFGAFGLIIGPLILVYFITFLRSYKEHHKQFAL
jgi:predicted PurR-regulated permease PerM